MEDREDKENSILVIIGDGVEEIEAIAPIDILRRAALQVVVASRHDRRWVRGRNNIVIEADTLLTEVLGDRFEAIIVPGGPQTAELRHDLQVRKLLCNHAAAGKLLAAICAAPLVLHDAGLLDDQAYTGHESIASELPDLITTEAVVLGAGRIITSRGAGTSLRFALSLVRELLGADSAKQIADAIHHQDRWPT